MHPAMADACLHLSVVPSAFGAPPALPAVPVACGCLLAPAKSSWRSQAGSAVAQPEQMRWLGSDSNAGLEVRGLMTNSLAGGRLPESKVIVTAKSSSRINVDADS